MADNLLSDIQSIRNVKMQLKGENSLKTVIIF